MFYIVDPNEVRTQAFAIAQSLSTTAVGQSNVVVLTCPRSYARSIGFDDSFARDVDELVRSLRDDGLPLRAFACERARHGRRAAAS